MKGNNNMKAKYVQVLNVKLTSNTNEKRNQRFFVEPGIDPQAKLESVKADFVRLGKVNNDTSFSIIEA